MYSKPTAIALAHPWPPLPTNLTKRQVLRFPSTETDQDDNKNTKMVDDLKHVQQTIEVEKRPLKMSSELTDKELISEIELAIYWDRHAYEYKPKRSASADNIRHISSEVKRSLRPTTADIGVQKDLNSEEECVENGNRAGEVEKKDVGSQTRQIRDKACQCYCWKHLPHASLVRSRSKSAAAPPAPAPKLVKSVSTSTTQKKNGMKNEVESECVGGDDGHKLHKCHHNKTITTIIPKHDVNHSKNNNNCTKSRNKSHQSPKKIYYTISKPKKSTEYTVNFRNPFKISDAESRILKTKILNRCFRQSSAF